MQNPSLRYASWTVGLALTLALPLLRPSVAQACGGTFCDSGPTSMPVDQTGENVLFYLTEDSVEAHIQISYDPETEAEKFAWVIPVMAVPEFEVGSQLLFDALLNGSVPRYGLSTQTDSCGDDGALGGDAGDEGSGTGAPNENDGDGEPGSPDVVLQKTVGAFEISVLEGGTVEGVMTWLGENGYQQDPNSEPILESYLNENFLFVAMKLAHDVGVGEIHPIVIRYQGVEPCVPLRLTAIAAQEDMDVRVFFLGEKRVVPVNYRHVLINPLKIDWFNQAANYKEVITMAVDAENADGNAFVTEYAGPSDVVQTSTFYNPAWDPAPIAALVDSPVGVVEALEAQGLMVCDPEWDTKCTFNHPLLEGILGQFVPVPDGVTAVEFYDCLECFVDQIDLAAWDAASFAVMFDERIINPAEHANDLVTKNPYLTRMYTTISPAEMGADPIFRENSKLGDVASLRIATQTTLCDGGVTVDLPDGRQVYFPPGAPLVWPEFTDEMPWEEDVDQASMAAEAPLISLTDNTSRIDELLDEWNGTKKDEADSTSEIGGCTCSVDPSTGTAGGIAFGLATLGLFGLVRRRRD